MDANSLPGAETICKPSRKCLEGSPVLRKMSIGQGEGEEVQPGLPGKMTFFREAKQVGFVLFQERNQSADARALHHQQFIAQSPAAWRTKHNGQRGGRIAADPEDVSHTG
jgi:hypothetical protein